MVSSSFLGSWPNFSRKASFVMLKSPCSSPRPQYPFEQYNKYRKQMLVQRACSAK